MIDYQEEPQLPKPPPIRLEKDYPSLLPVVALIAVIVIAWSIGTIVWLLSLLFRMN